VAVVGVSASGGGIGRRVFDNLRDGEYQGSVYPVHPRARAISGIPTVSRVRDLPDGVDLLMVSVPAPAVEEVLEDAGRRGIPAAVIISAGFAEAGGGGAAAEGRIQTVGRRYGMRLVGPNCLGVVNTDPSVRMNASFLPEMAPRGSIAMASQSGALGLSMLRYAAREGFGISSFVSMGNKVDVSGNDLLQYWEQDPATRAIVLYLESFGNPRRFVRLAHRVGRQKPILMVKAARSDDGLRAAASHTAALLSSDHAVDALVRQTGVIRAESLEELMEVAGVLARQPLPTGSRVAIVTNAGGPAVLAVDALAAHGLHVPPAPDRLVETLRTAIPGAASLRNPFDLIASAGPEEYRAALRAVLDDPSFDAVLPIFVPLDLVDPSAVWAAIVEEVERTPEERRKTVVASVMDGSAGASNEGRGSSVPRFGYPEAAARALGRVRRYAAWRETPAGYTPKLLLSGLNLSIAHGLLRAESAHHEGRGGFMDAVEAFRLLGALGIPVAMPRWAHDPAGAALLAEAVDGPVAVKLASRTLIHKTEWHGVVLNLAGARQVQAACEAMGDELRRLGQSEHLEGFLVQPMVQPGIECLIGMAPDPAFGPVMAFGMGGVDVEGWQDITVGIPPLSDRDAWAMVSGIHAHALLERRRGDVEWDREALVDALLRISAMVDQFPEVAELDLNPVVVGRHGAGVRVVDARIRLRDDTLGVR
jgi:acyl-CoA synthetase (NDP forming)